MAAQTSTTISADVRFQSDRERLERLQQTVDIKDQSQVRELQRKLKEFDDRAGLQQKKLILADPRVDRNNAELNKFAASADHREGDMLRSRALIGLPEDKKQEFLAQAAADGARRLGLPSDLQELAAKSQATRDGLAAYAVAKSIAGSGTVDKNLEYVVTRGMIKFDTPGDVLVEAQARSLTGGMTINRIDDYWGGSPQGTELRRTMGPESRAAISAAAAKGVQDVGISLKAAQITREAIKRHEVPPPPPEARNSQEGAKNYLERASAAAGAAVKEAVAQLNTKLRVPGAAEIIPAQ